MNNELTEKNKEFEITISEKEVEELLHFRFLKESV